MLSRVKYTIDEHTSQLKGFFSRTDNFDFFKTDKEIILIDIVPDFLNPEFSKFHFENFSSEEKMILSITSNVIDYMKKDKSHFDTLVVQLIQSF